MRCDLPLPECLRQREVLHQPKRLRMFSLGGVKEAVSTAVFVGVSESQLISDRDFLEECEGVSNADVVVCSRKRSGPDCIASRRSGDGGRGDRDL